MHQGMCKLDVEAGCFSSFGVRFPLTATISMLNTEEISTSGLIMHPINQDVILWHWALCLKFSVRNSLWINLHAEGLWVFNWAYFMLSAMCMEHEGSCASAPTGTWLWFYRSKHFSISHSYNWLGNNKYVSWSFFFKLVEQVGFVWDVSHIFFFAMEISILFFYTEVISISVLNTPAPTHFSIHSCSFEGK